MNIISFVSYLEHMGLNVAVTADSITRWLVSEQTQSSRISCLFSRAGRFACIGSPSRDGSITIFAALAPQGGDYADGVCVHALSVTNVGWFMDRKLAQRRQFPAVHNLICYSKYKTVLKTIYEPEYLKLQEQIMGLFREDDQLQEIVQLVGQVNGLFHLN